MAQFFKLLFFHSSFIFVTQKHLSVIDFSNAGHIEEEITEKLHVDTGDGDIAELIVHNDEINTFEWVIQSFIEVLKHSSQQAEQLSLIIHFKGKACVKTDTYRALKPLKQALIDRGLSVTIEALES